MTISDFRFAGVVPILATPFQSDESLDLASLDRTVRFMASLAVDGVTILGVLGESNRLTDRDRAAVIRTAVAAAGGHLPVIVGASHPGTLATIDLMDMAAREGATAVMVAPSAEPVPAEDRVFEYFRRIGTASPLPLVVQDHPASTAVHMGVPLLARIAREVPNVKGIKEEGVPTPPRLRALRQALGENAPGIMTGLGALYGRFDLEAGSDGFNTGFAFPEVLVAMVRAASIGDWARVRALYARFLPLIVFEQQPGVAVRKEILRRRGLLDHATVRHPGAGLPPGAAEQLDALLADALPGADLAAPVSLD
ncbi:MAG: dihydrodipicolinate synthase family protein [Betaproteobacteria bacterium]